MWSNLISLALDVFLQFPVLFLLILLPIVLYAYVSLLCNLRLKAAMKNTVWIYLNHQVRSWLGPGNSCVRARTRFHFLPVLTAGCPKVSPRRDLDTRSLRLVRRRASGDGLSSVHEGESLPTSFALAPSFFLSLLPPASVFLSIVSNNVDGCIVLDITKRNMWKWKRHRKKSINAQIAL